MRIERLRKRDFSGRWRFLIPGVLTALILVSGVWRLRAAESYMDIAADAVKTEITTILTERTGDLPGGAPVTIGVGSFLDETGRFERDLPTLRQLLLGRIALDDRYTIVPNTTLDEATKAIAGDLTPDRLSVDQLVKLGVKTKASYLFFGRIRDEGGKALLQGYFFSLRKGVLVSAPQFSVSAAGMEGTRTEPAPPAKEAAPAPEPVKPEAVEAKPSAPVAVSAPMPGQLEPLKGDISPYPVLDIDASQGAGGGTATIFIMTTHSLEAYGLKGLEISQSWVGNYKKPYARRGMAGRLIVGRDGATQTVIVSMNSFSKSFEYSWTGKSLEKTKNHSGVVVDALIKRDVLLQSAYGPGVVLFSGKNAALVNEAVSPPAKKSLALPEEFYSACILSASENAKGNGVVAVDAGGILHLYGPDGGEKAVTDSAYGGEVNCWVSTKGVAYVLTTTPGWKNDGLVLLSCAQNRFEIVWRSRQVDGAVFHHKLRDITGDGVPEVIGLVEQKGGINRLFIASPEFNAGGK